MIMQMGAKKDASDEVAFDCRVVPIIMQIGTQF